MCACSVPAFINAPALAWGQQPAAALQTVLNADGEYVVTDSHLFNPNVALKSNWQELKKTEYQVPSG